MNIQRQPSEIKITFSPGDYCLVKCEDEVLGDFVLHHLIDRSEKGKSPDLGTEVLYLSGNEAKVFKEAGFSEYL